MSSVRVELCVAAGLADTFALSAVHYGLVYHVRQSKGTRTGELFVYQPFRTEDGYFKDLPGVEEDRARMEQERGSESELDRCLVRKSAFRIDPSALRAPVAGTLLRVFVLLRPQGGESLSQRLGLSLALRTPELQRAACSDAGVALKPLWSDAEWRADRSAEAVPFDGDLARYVEALTLQANRLVDAQDAGAAPKSATGAPPRRAERSAPPAATGPVREWSLPELPAPPPGPVREVPSSAKPPPVVAPPQTATAEPAARSRRPLILMAAVALAFVASLIDRYGEWPSRAPQSETVAPAQGVRIPEPSSTTPGMPPVSASQPAGGNRITPRRPPSAEASEPAPSRPPPQSEPPAPSAAEPAPTPPDEAASAAASPPADTTDAVPSAPSTVPDPAASDTAPAVDDAEANSAPSTPQQTGPGAGPAVPADAAPPSRPEAAGTAMLTQTIAVPQGSSASTPEDLSVFVYEEHDSAIHALLDTVRPNDRNAFARRLQWLRANVPATPAPDARLRGQRETFDAQVGALVAQADRAGDRAALRRAVTLSERFLQSNFGDAPAHRNHALALTALGDGSAALQAAFYAIAFDPEAPGSYVAAGLAFARAGYGQLAVDAFCVALRTGDYAPALLADVDRIRRGEDFDFAAARSATRDTDLRCPRERWRG